jgi:uncharacterized protein (DUF2141 family)
LSICRTYGSLLYTPKNKLDANPNNRFGLAFFMKNNPMLLAIFSLLFTFGNSHPMAPSLKVEITNVNKAGGNVRVALYKPIEKFGTAKPDFFKIIPITTTGPQRVSFEVEAGKYALAVFHDLNGNEKLDKNLVGYPKEPFGFSNNFRPVISAPSFSDCAFTHGAQGTSISIKLID